MEGRAPRLFYRPATDDVTLQQVFPNVENIMTDSVLVCVINFSAPLLVSGGVVSIKVLVSSDLGESFLRPLPFDLRASGGRSRYGYRVAVS